MYRYIAPQLPNVATLKDIRLQTPVQIFSADGKLITQYGEKRRIPLRLNQMPPELVNAFVTTEDSRFYEHHGVDLIGILRAASNALLSGHASQGASTITQQLTRNFFLIPERALIRKIKEAFLAVWIERLLSKDEILELYLNKTYLDYRAYSVGAAAQVYFGKNIGQLSLSEMAMIAGLPKTHFTFNPLYSPNGRWRGAIPSWRACTMKLHYPGRIRVGARCGAGGPLPRAGNRFFRALCVGNVALGYA